MSESQRVEKEKIEGPVWQLATLYMVHSQINLTVNILFKCYVSGLLILIFSGCKLKVLRVFFRNKSKRYDQQLSHVFGRKKLSSFHSLFHKWKYWEGSVFVLCLPCSPYPPSLKVDLQSNITSLSFPLFQSPGTSPVLFNHFKKIASVVTYAEK